MQDVSLITTIAAGFTGAWLLGLLTQKLGLSPIVGYLLAGVLIGPHTPGFAGDIHVAHQLAEIGVILLMFGVGLHFKLKDLLAVRGVAIPGAVVQSLVATLLSIIVFRYFDVPLPVAAMLGMSMAVASTVVLMRVLMDADMLDSPPGHVAVGWLIVEDIFTVLLLVIVPVLGARLGDAGPGSAPAGAAQGLLPTLGLALLKLGALIVAVFLVGRRVVPWILVRVARLRSRELFTLTVLVFSIAMATAAYVWFGASMALGAFLAGMMVGQSQVSHQAAAEAMPLRDAFAVLFFVSVGMLFSPAIILDEPLMVAAALAIILIAKPLAALVIVALLGHSFRTALTVALGLAQIGEFSFILSDVARTHGLMEDSGHSVLVAAAIISITLNPLLFRSLHPLERWVRARPRLWAILNGRAERRTRELNAALRRHASDRPGETRAPAIVVGYGPVGRTVHRLLRDAAIPTVVIDYNLDTVAELNARGDPAVYGDASHESILEQADARAASHFIVTLPQSADRAAVVAAARNLNPRAHILVRARYLREREDLERAGATAAVFEEAEAAVALARLVLADTGVQRQAAERTIQDLRLRLILENVSVIRSQRVRSVMVPWPRVRRLRTDAPRDEVLRQISQERYSRWPVVEPGTDRPVGYLLVKDLIAQAAGADDWTRLIRPLRTVRADDDVESILTRMQRDGSTLYAVEDTSGPVGIVSMGDILGQVVGRIQDEYPHGAPASLPDAIAAGAVVLGLAANSADDAIAELARALPPSALPPGVHVAELAQAREEDMPTDLGVGIAVPHARCPGLRTPLVAVGRSDKGILFSPPPAVPVRLVFLLVTPAEHPDQQLALLGQVGTIAASDELRRRLFEAASPGDLLRIVAEGVTAGAPGRADAPAS